MQAANITRGRYLLSLSFVFAALACGRINFEAAEGSEDAARSDAPASDAPASDAEILEVGLSCERAADSSVIALYTFGNDSAANLADGVGSHSAAVVGAVSHVPGPAVGCGQAAFFTTASEGYAVIDDAPAWQLSEGSVDFWFRASAFPADLAGLVSRDAGGTSTAGHLGIFLDSMGRVGFRLQVIDALDSAAGGVCSASGAIKLDEWNHLGVNFGSAGSELWLNGSKLDAPGNLGLVTCQTGNAIGIDGNLNPWTIGVNSGTSDEGEALPVSQGFDGAMDHLRISDIRRDFSGSAYAKPSP